MRGVTILSLLALSACASGSSTTTTRPESMRVIGAGGGSQTLNMTNTTSANVARVNYSLDKVWRLMPAVFDSLKIPLTTLDPAKHQIGNEGMKVRQKLGNVALSKYIDCGQAQIGPSADSYDVFMSVMVVAHSISPTETEIQTTVESAAKPVTFAQEYSRCSTKGLIETTVGSIISAKLAAAK